ncbi:MAG TPA: TIGR04211 family SH3 domain-containing protein [Candidatus Competibacteraceae bacterium]|nr:TIGR04211 family SH3 domain-containing protein [Candidatus Competibacteraceae bacterium]HRZ06442.1 TIGR04211 family SH3 domain-containing protein [Candidatus Competibacteraceae bacterium]
MRRLFPCCLALALGALVSPIQAETRYATDSFKLPMRSGGSANNRIVRMVPSGTPLEVLETNDEGFAKVRTPERIVGWMLTRDLMNEASPRDRVLQLEGRVTTLEEENQTLRGENESVKVIRNDLTRCGEELSEVRNKASQTLAIDEENRKLQQEMATMREQMERLEQQSSTLRDDTSRNWFLSGAGVVLGSLFLGLVIPLIPWRRKRHWDQF